MGRVQDPFLYLDVVDELYWNVSLSGGFSLGSTLKIIRNVEVVSAGEEIKWKQLWSMVVPHRIRFFLWLAIQDRVMTNGNRFIRRFTNDPRFLVCEEIEENIIHVL